MAGAAMPEPGAQAPAFEGKTPAGDKLSLASLKGQKVALYFYPEDFTPGCTEQACSLRDGYKMLQDAGVAVVGVSPDGDEKHQKFVAEYKLPFPLLADPDKTIMTAYGTWGEKNLYGKIVVGVKRTTFLIDEEGVVKHVIKRPKVKDHAVQILKKFGLSN
ncbi:MAG: thioredoxin-dependent thiol peroxidase [Bacteroidota bacterium]